RLPSSYVGTRFPLSPLAPRSDIDFAKSILLRRPGYQYKARLVRINFAVSMQPSAAMAFLPLLASSGVPFHVSLQRLINLAINKNGKKVTICLLRLCQIQFQSAFRNTRIMSCAMEIGFVMPSYRIFVTFLPPSLRAI
ncbi:MAG: hypothetical protein ABSA17_06675, partial [Rhabdochlamydiaceae bacterium]